MYAAARRTSLFALGPVLALSLLILGLAGCGGGAKVDPSGAATLGLGGGTVLGLEGTQVVVPAGVLETDTTIRIARDSTGMPALPGYATPVGSAWQVTPHGATFAAPVQVQLPALARPLAEDEVLRVAKVSPGGTWELLMPEASAAALSVNVLSFSYFVPVSVKQTGPVRAAPPLELQTSTYSCGGGSCRQIGPDAVEVVFDVSSNRGSAPQGCVDPRLRVAGKGQIRLSGQNPGSTPLSGVANAYQFRLSMATTVSKDLMGRRGTSTGELSVELVCALGTASESSLVMVTAPVHFPSYSISSAGVVVESPPPFQAAVESVTCNGGPCGEVVGPQDVRLTVAVAPGSILPSNCQVPLEFVLNECNGAPLLATTSAVPTTGSPPWAAGGSFTFSSAAANTPGVFHVNPPVPARAKLLCWGGRCANGTIFDVARASIGFVTPQQPTPPSFTTQPLSIAVRAGQTASFTAAARGFGTPRLQWYTRAREGDTWTLLAGATAGTWTTPTTTLADNGRQFKVVATNGVGQQESLTATLTVNVNELAPIITAQPATLRVVSGSDAVFAVVATGTGALSYQWRRNGVALVGANGSILRLAAAGHAEAGAYSVDVANSEGSVPSLSAELIVADTVVEPTAPTIVTQPASAQVGVGNTATFAAGVAGTGPFTYQWRKGSAPVAGATLAYLTIPAVVAADAGTYSVVVSNAAGQATSAGALLTVLAPAPAVAPVITTQPAPQVQPPGGSATFAVAASGTGPLTYQWSKGGASLPGATEPVLLLSNLSAADEGSYAVTVRNAAGQVTSAGATLTVLGAPVIVAQPTAATVTEGATATFEVNASGAGLRYQWLRNGLVVDGATSARYVTPPLTLADGGAVYAVIVSNAAGIVLSEGAVLTVDAAPPPAPSPLTGKVAAGGQHTCAVTAAGQVACWGANGSGQIGRGDLRDQPTPYLWSLPEAVVSVAAGKTASCAVTTSGAVYCSGSAAGGAMVPTRIAGFTGVRQVTLGWVHACLLSEAGTVHCWGNNSAYQLGNGGTTFSATPVEVQGQSGTLSSAMVEIDAGDSHTCARTGGGEVLCWGDNAFSRAGAAGVAAVPVASLVSGTGVVSQLALGETFTCALGSDAVVRCWGVALDGSNTSSELPAQVAGLATTGALGAGSAMACALDDTSRVRCWGVGMMGNGNVNQTQTFPTLVSGLTAVAEVAGGLGHTCALRADGTLACWGSNAAFQLGTGDLAPRTTPEDVVLTGGFWRR